jgi:hypothetical protein
MRWPVSTASSDEDAAGSARPLAEFWVQVERGSLHSRILSGRGGGGQTGRH